MRKNLEEEVARAQGTPWPPEPPDADTPEQLAWERALAAYRAALDGVVTLLPPTSATRLIRRLASEVIKGALRARSGDHDEVEVMISAAFQAMYPEEGLFQKRFACMNVIHHFGAAWHTADVQGDPRAQRELLEEFVSRLEEAADPDFGDGGGAGDDDDEAFKKLAALLSAYKPPVRLGGGNKRLSGDKGAGHILAEIIVKYFPGALGCTFKPDDPLKDQIGGVRSGLDRDYSKIAKKRSGIKDAMKRL